MSGEAEHALHDLPIDRALLQALLAELAAYPAPDHDDAPDAGAVVGPLRIRTALGDLSFLSTTTVFGTPVEVTLSELAIESFFPADAATGQILRSAGSLLQRDSDPAP